MGHLLERGEEPHLVERHESAGQQHLTAELTSEVGVTLEERDPAAPAREQIREGRAGGAGPDHDDVSHGSTPSMPTLHGPAPSRPTRHARGA